MLRKRVALFSTTFLLVFALPAIGFSETYLPDTGHLRGFIYKSDEKTPFWGAQVVLQDVKSRRVFKSNVTDSKGDYRVLNVPAGQYMVLILSKKKFYKIVTIDFLIKIVESKTATISFALKGAISPLFFLLDPCCTLSVIPFIPPCITCKPPPPPPTTPVER